ncbi:hypothetical protein [Planctobacterium marinum]|uniref:YtkA-like domain-containing protein n=1 Tax=Planctobacterium marinum TaxID=1631968 RepID=A0AA48KT04_9ALTE|nr:hypothetical protein MACH26_25450 [Planctobacterium marinum]
MRPNKKFSTYTTLFIACFSTFSANLNACDLHAAGGFGNFPMMPPPHSSAFKQSLIVEPITLKHAKKVMVSSGKDAAILFSYRVPKGYDNVAISFSGPQEVNFPEARTIYPKQGNGVFRMKYSAAKKGRYSMKIHIKANQDNHSVSRYQSVEIYAG